MTLPSSAIPSTERSYRPLRVGSSTATAPCDARATSHETASVSACASESSGGGCVRPTKPSACARSPVERTQGCHVVDSGALFCVVLTAIARSVGADRKSALPDGSPRLIRTTNVPETAEPPSNEIFAAAPGAKSAHCRSPAARSEDVRVQKASPARCSIRTNRRGRRRHRH